MGRGVNADFGHEANGARKEAHINCHVFHAIPSLTAQRERHGPSAFVVRTPTNTKQGLPVGGSTIEGGTAMSRFKLGPWIRTFAVAAAGLFFVMGTAAAQNLITNGTFDHDIVGWTPENSHVTLSFLNDVGDTLPGGSGPGSIEVVYAQWAAGDSGASQVVQHLSEGVTYTVSGTAFAPDDEDNLAEAIKIAIQWRDAENVPLRVVDVLRFGNGPLEKGTWLSASGDFVAPAGAATAEIDIEVYTPPLENETRPGVVYFDDIVFAEKGSNTAKQVLFVPASASAHGSHSTFWTTTGWFANNVSFPVELKAAFLRQGQDNTAALESLTSIGTVPGDGYLEIGDMVAMIGGAGLTGGLYIEATAQAGGLPATLVEATTYTFTPNPGGGGGYGQGVPAVGTGAKNDVTVPGVYQNGAYRTNIGALNTSASQVEIRVQIFGADGTMLGNQTWTLKPYEQKQVSVTKLGVSSASGGYVKFTRVGSSGSFQAYATVVDQKTGDAVYSLGR